MLVLGGRRVLGGARGGGGGGVLYETVGVGLEDVGLEGGRVKWLMMVEAVFEGSCLEAQTVFKRGTSSIGVWVSEIRSKTGRAAEALDTSRFWSEMSCSSLRCFMMPENVLEWSLGKCLGGS